MSIQHAHLHDSQSQHNVENPEKKRNILIQIYRLAECTKRRMVPNDVEPLSLIDLIQASTQIFQLNNIRAPDDAVYHRYLLSLSIDPEQDWYKKVLNFDYSNHSRRKRLRSRDQCTDFIQHQHDHFNDMLSLHSPIQSLTINDHRRNSISNDTFDMDTKCDRGVTQGMSQLIKPITSKEMTEHYAAEQISRIHAQKVNILTWCTNAIFHWITLTLPTKFDYSSTEDACLLPLCILRRISVDIRAFKKSAHRVWKWRIEILFHSWCQEIQRLKSFRVQRFIRERTLTLETAFQCIQQWRFLTETTRCLKDRTQWIYQRQSRLKLRLSLVHWRRRLDCKMRQRQGENNRMSQVKRNVLRNWHNWFQLNRKIKLLGIAARKKRSYLRWRHFRVQKQETRDLLCEFADQQRLRALGDSWNRLHINAFKKLTEQTRWNLWIETSCRRQKIKAFCRWKLRVNQCKDTRKRLDQLIEYAEKRCVCQIFVAWADWTERNVRLTRKVLNWTSARANKQSQMYLKNWIIHVKILRRTEKSLAESVERLRRKRVWSSWKKVTRTLNLIRCLQTAYSKHNLAIITIRWRQYTTKKIVRSENCRKFQLIQMNHVLTFYWKLLLENVHVEHQKELAIQQLKALQNSKVERLYFAVWRFHYSRIKSIRSRGENLQHCIQRHYWMRTFWGQWRHQFWLKSEAQLAKIQLHRYQISHAFRLWSDFTNRSKNMREQSMNLAERRNLYHLQMSIRRWKERIGIKRQARVVRQNLRTRVITMVWRNWRQALRDRYLKNDKQKLKSFQRWKTVWCIRKRYRKLLTRTSFTSKQRIIETHFHAWRMKWQFTAAQQFHNLMLHSELLRYKSKRIVQWWNSFRLYQLKTRLLVNQLQALKDHKLLLSAFNHLSIFKKTRKIKTSRNQLVHSCYCKNLIRRVYIKWVNSLRTKQLMSRQTNTAIQCLNTLKLKRVKRWQNFVKTRMLLKFDIARTVNISITSQLRLHLKHWQLFISHNRFARSLKLKAAKFRFLRLMSLHLTSWKAFVTRKKQDQELMHQARRHCCQQRETRAFQAWKIYRRRCERSHDAITKYKIQTLLKSICIWREFQHFQRRKQQNQLRADTFLIRHTCHKVLKEWSSATRQNLSIQFYARKGQVFQAWVRHTRCIQSSRHFLIKIRSQTLVRNFTAWKQKVGLNLQKYQKAQHQINVLYIQNVLRHVITSWKQYFRLCQYAQKRRQRSLQKLVKFWRCIATKFLRLRHHALHISERAMQLFKQTMWTSWRLKAKHLRHVRILSRNIAATQINSNLQQRVIRWKRFTTFSLAIKIFIRCQEIKTLHRTFIHGLQRFLYLKHKKQDLMTQMKGIHKVFLKDWLIKKLQRRMAAIAAFEVIQSDLLKRMLKLTWQSWFDYHIRKQYQQASICQLCEKISQHKNFQFSLKRIRLQAMLQRWKMIHVTKVFECWAHCTQTQKQARIHTLKALKFWLYAQLKRFFTDWKVFYQHEKKHKRIHAMNVQTKIKRIWHLWRNFHNIVRNKRSITLQLCQLHKNQIYRTFIKVWRQAAALKSIQREEILELYLSSCRRLLAALLNEWQKVIRTKKVKRRQQTVALVMYNTTIVKQSFSAWKIYVAEVCEYRRELQINMKRLCVLTLHSTFRAWCSLTNFHKEVTKMTRQLAIQRDLELSFRILTQWHLYVKKTTQCRIKSLSFLYFSRLYQGIKALRYFMQAQRYQRLMYQDAQSFRLAAKKKLVQKAFFQWRQIATLAQKSRIVMLEYHNNKLIPAIWSAWVAFIITRQKARDQKLKAMIWSRKFQISTVWNALLVYFKQRKKWNGIIKNHKLHYRLRLLKSFFIVWYSASQKLQHFRDICDTFHTRWRAKTMFQLFRLFHNHMIRTRLLRNAKTSVSSNNQMMVMFKAWNVWRKRLLFLRCGKRRMLQRYWKAWIRKRKSNEAIERIQNQFQIKILKNLQHRSFKSWKFYVMTRYITKYMKEKSCAFVRTHLIKRFWISWIEYVEQTHRMKSQMIKNCHHMRLFRQLQAVRAFQTFKWLQMATFQAFLRAKAFHFYQVSTRYFFKWKTVATKQRSDRQKFRHYSNMLNHSSQKKYFCAWVSIVTQQRSLREKASQTLALCALKQLHRFLMMWKALMIHISQTQVADEFYTVKMSTKVLIVWKKFLLFSKVIRMERVHTLRQIESCFRSWRKTIATTQQIRVFEVKIATKRWFERLKRRFQLWKVECLQKIDCRNLMARLAVNIRLQFRFIIWKRFTAQRKRLASLLLQIQCQSPGYPVCRQAVSIDNDTSLANSKLKFQDRNQDYEIMDSSAALARIARSFQQFHLIFELPQAWHQWRHLFHAHLFNRMHSLQNYFQLWHQSTQSKRQYRLKVINFNKRRQQLILENHFQAWARLVNHVKQLQKHHLYARNLQNLEIVEMMRRKRRTIKKFWLVWMRYVKESRNLRTSLTAYYQARVLTKVWSLWSHDYLTYVNQKNRKFEYCNRQMQIFYLCRTIQKLRQRFQKLKRVQFAIVEITKRQKWKILANVFCQWNQKCDLEKKIGQFCTIVCFKKVRRYFIEWKNLILERKWQRHAVSNFQYIHLEERRNYMWNQWRRHVSIKAGKDAELQKAANYYVCNLVRKRWFTYTQCMQQHRDQFAQLCVFRGRRTIHQRHTFCHARRLRHLYQRFVLQKHLQLWHVAVQNVMALRLMTSRQLKLGTKILVMWHQVAMQRRHWRQVCKSFIVRKTMRALDWKKLEVAFVTKSMAILEPENMFTTNATKICCQPQ
ncbi:hypothetical protein Plhal710r2_c023g0095451 [Plasmopara halstedii]